MKPKLSPLVLLDFAILNSRFKFISSPEDADIKQLAQSYELDLDFAIVPEPNSTRVFIKVAINQGEKQQPGYAIFAEGVAIFDMSQANTLEAGDKKNLVQYSAVSIALNSLRGAISTLTSNAPFGRYILPSLDMNDLFQKKRQAIQKSQAAKGKK